MAAGCSGAGKASPFVDGGSSAGRQVRSWVTARAPAGQVHSWMTARAPEGRPAVDDCSGAGRAGPLVDDCSGASRASPSWMAARALPGRARCPVAFCGRASPRCSSGARVHCRAGLQERRCHGALQHRRRRRRSGGRRHERAIRVPPGPRPRTRARRAQPPRCRGGGRGNGGLRRGTRCLGVRRPASASKPTHRYLIGISAASLDRACGGCATGARLAGEAGGRRAQTAGRLGPVLEGALQMGVEPVAAVEGDRLGGGEALAGQRLGAVVGEDAVLERQAPRRRERGGVARRE